MSCPGDNYVVPGANPCSGGGGGGVVQTIIAGNAGIGVFGTAENVVLTNEGVYRVFPGTGITIGGGDELNPVINATAGLIPRPTYTIFVSKAGDDLGADGSLNLPFSTIQGAISYRNELDLTVMCEIIIFAGTYDESIILTQGSTNLTGYTNSPLGITSPVIITGDIQFSVPDSRTQNVCNIRFADAQVTYDCTGNSRLYFRNCYINGFVLANSYNVGTSIYFDDCTLVYVGSEVMFAAVGAYLYIHNCSITHITTNNPTINVQNASGFAGRLDMRQTYIVNATTSTTAFPQVRFQTGSASTLNVITQCVFTWQSSNVDIGTNKCCVQLANGAGLITFDLITMNQFDCDGAAYNTGGSPVVIQDRGTGTGNTTVTVFGGNYAGQLANRIDSGIAIISRMVYVA
jgi:hypothetical protein